MGVHLGRGHDSPQDRRGARKASEGIESKDAMSKPELVKLEIDGAGFPSSSESFRNVIGALARDCFVITPDLPGFGSSELVERPSFSRFADLIYGLLARLGAGSFHLYLHDYGAAVGLYLATRAPRRIRGLIVQNANAHESGMGPHWSATRAYWDDPTPERETAATAHLTFERWCSTIAAISRGSGKLPIISIAGSPRR